MGDVIGTGRHKKNAPRCMVRFRCPKCLGEQVLDAYKGAPRHAKCSAGGGERPIMEPVSLIRTREQALGADEMARRAERQKGRMQ